MKIYLDKNVFDQAKDRLRWVFERFPNVYVGFSGGKDSTVVLNLALEVAEEMNRLPVNVLFIDQEAEWNAVIDYVRDVMHDPRVKPFWLQVPIQLKNATSETDPWLYCWAADKEESWMRPKEPDSIHENIYGTNRFGEMFNQVLATNHPDEPACIIGGVRTEESPARLMATTSRETFEGETWGKVVDRAKSHFVFYPVYDWSYTDVWKAIHDNNWQYTKIYDFMYQYGLPIRNMRVSNLHHETALRTLFYLQEIEPDTWNKLTSRLTGINTAGQLKSSFFAPKTLPPMFKDWPEYRDHLLEHLVTNEADKAYYRRVFPQHEAKYDHNPDVLEKLYKVEIGCIVSGDTYDAKLGTFRSTYMYESKGAGKHNKHMKGKRSA